MAYAHPTNPLSRSEFIALMGMLMATVAFSIDAMLPAMGQIAAELSPDAPGRAQMIIPFFVIGMGIGTLFTGPLSDAFGRRPIVLGGAVVYCLGALLAWLAPTLETLLLARLVQGFGASGARVVALAIVRDTFSGRAMAQVTSMIIMVFTTVPAIAPTLGTGIIWIGGWRAIFAAFLIFSLAIAAWFWLRQPETLPPERRRPLNFGEYKHAAREIFAHPLVRRSILVQIMCYAMLFTMISVVQPIFDRVMGAADTFPLWFGATAIAALAGPILNARLVVRVGMFQIVATVLTLEVAVSVLYVVLLETGVVALDLVPVFFLWLVTVFAMAGMTLGNLNAMALEPMGHIAGTASSLMTAIGSAAAGVIAIPAAALFIDSQVPIVLVIAGFALAARLLMVGSAFDASREATA